jgi:hypothetical protein
MAYINIRAMLPTDEDITEIQFGTSEEILHYDRASSDWFSVIDGNEEISILIEDIDYMIKALNELKKITGKDK